MTDWSLLDHTGHEFILSKLTQPVVIFFYPRDDTPGCTIENQEFSQLYPEFKRAGYAVVGISRDSIKSHCKFVDKYQLSIPLLADEEEVVCNLFQVMKMKNMYGKQVRGIERSTFILDTQGNIIKEWRKVSVPNHAQEVLNFILT